jgi:hypothetical protein
MTLAKWRGGTSISKGDSRVWAWRCGSRITFTAPYLRHFAAVPDVSYGLKADFRTCRSLVRFAAKSGLGHAKLTLHLLENAVFFSSSVGQLVTKLHFPYQWALSGGRKR